MTAMELEKLTDRELDALVASQVMRWTDVREQDSPYYPRDVMGKPPSGPDRAFPVAWYSTNPNAAREVEAEIERRNLTKHWAAILVDMVCDPERNDSGFYVVGPHCIAAIAKASPRQRCIAALRAVTEPEDKP